MNTESRPVGSGVYILSTLWLISILLCIVSIRTGRLVGVLSLVVSSVITLLLIFIPQSQNDLSESEQIYDKLFIINYCILGFMLFSALGGIGFFVAYYCMLPIETKKMTHWAQ